MAIMAIPHPDITVSCVTTPSLRPALTFPIEEDKRGKSIYVVAVDHNALSIGLEIAL